MHQVAGLIEEIKANEDYSNLYFWGPQKIIELLEESKKISTIDYTKYKINVAKEILVKSFLAVIEFAFWWEKHMRSIFVCLMQRITRL